MKNQINKLGLLAFLIFGFTSTINAQINVEKKAQKKADKDTEAFRYELEAVQTGAEGTYLLKVWSYSKSPNVATEQSKKNAVHGVIFKGFTGKQGVPGKPALTNNPNLEQEKAEFFDQYFASGGKYMKFVSVANDGAVAAEDRMKIGKEYKIGVVVSVNVSALRKDLEDAGVIKGLASGF